MRRKFARGRLARADGSGLGLAIVSRIVADHKGRLVLESELGTGTTAKVYLPIVGRLTSVSERILIVEDDPTLRRRAARQPRLRGLSRRRGGGRQVGHQLRARVGARSGRARPDAAGLRRPRFVSGAAAIGQSAHHHFVGARPEGRQAEGAEARAPTTTSRSRSTCRSCSRASAPCCGARIPRSSVCSSGSSSSTSARSARAATRRRCT